jgi:hypothetical protein
MPKKSRDEILTEVTEARQPVIGTSGLLRRIIELELRAGIKPAELAELQKAGGLEETKAPVEPTSPVEPPAK